MRDISLDTMPGSGTRSADTYERDPVPDALGEEGVMVAGFLPATCGRWPVSSHEMTPNRPVHAMRPLEKRRGDTGRQAGTDRVERCPRRLGVPR
jgi:hypothetical protein